MAWTHVWEHLDLDLALVWSLKTRQDRAEEVETFEYIRATWRDLGQIRELIKGRIISY
jgi:hypothetical protein